MRKVSLGVLVLVVLVLGACRNNRLSPEQMQHKLDSIAKLEAKEKLEAQGIHLDRDVSPVQLFYDSLGIQTLPIRYSEDYVRFLPGYKVVPAEMASFMGLEGRIEPKAISLPETAGARLMILAADEGDGLYSLWLYSLDDEYLPVDKLCLYAIEDEEDVFDIDPEEFIQYFSITSDYEIHLLDFSKEANKTRTEEVYCLDPARHFILQNSVEDE